MARLSLSLMGPPQILLNGQPVTEFKTQKVQALLAYLAVESAREHPRAELTGLLWPEQPEAAARTNLRVSLHRLRRALGDDGQQPFLRLTRTTAQFNAAGDCWLDVATFSALLAQCRAHKHDRLDTCASCSAALAQAVGLYRGDFLAGVVLADSAAFEEWVLVQREALRRETLSALDTLAAFHERRSDFEALAQAAGRQLELEPWHEPAHRQLMRAFALSGKRSAALAQYETCRRVLQQELGIEPDVETRALYERIRANELSATALARQVPPNNLPYQLTPFIGREAELAEIAAHLQRPGARLVSLVGPGGMGKTRLALEAARAHFNVFGDGVYFIPLGPVTSAAEIGAAAVAALGLQLHGASPNEALLRYLSDKRVLLILDNFEHVLDGADLVVELLHGAPQLQIIATSRERLDVRGEQLLFVQGLDYAVETTLTGAAASPAVSFFIQCARRVQPAFRLTEEDLPGILRICAHTQGMPLGLELAAAWVETLSPGLIAAEIERNADFLASDWRDLPERQRSMRAVFDWSWRLLNEHERGVFRKLSIFRGGFTREAAQAVVGATQRVLTRLAHKSLLQWRAAGAAGRFEIHELLRQFAGEQLSLAGDEWARVDAKHREYFLSFVAARELRLTRDDSRAALDEMRAELDNIQRAWSSAGAASHVEALERSAYALWQFYLLSGLWEDGVRVFAHAAEHAGAAAGLRSKLLAAQVHFLNHQGKYRDAIPLVRRVMAIAQASGSRESEAGAELLWAQALHLTGRTQESRKHAERALQLAVGGESEWLRDVEWESHVWLGGIYGGESDYRAAIREFTEALHLCRRWRKRNGEVRCTSNLGTQAANELRFDSALQYAQEALRLSRELGNRWLEGVAEYDLTETGLLQRDYAHAGAHGERALQIFRELGDRLYQVPTLGQLARLMDALGQYGRAREWFDQFLQADEEVGALQFSFEPWCGLALHAHHTGDDARALACTETMQRVAQQVPSRAWLAQTHVVRGHVLTGLQRWSEAETEFEQGIKGYAELEQDALSSEPRAGLTWLALARGDLARALSLVESIVKDLAARLPLAVDDPFFIYLVCYRVLAAKEDPRAAALLQTAQAQLRALAGGLADQSQRCSFLDNVAIHRELLRADTATSLT